MRDDGLQRSAVAACSTSRSMTPQSYRPSRNLVNLDRVLKALEAFDARKARSIELRYFSGLTHDEIGLVLEIQSQHRRQGAAACAGFISSYLFKGSRQTVHRGCSQRPV